MKCFQPTGLGLIATALALCEPAVLARAQGAGHPIVSGSTPTPGPPAEYPVQLPGGAPVEYLFRGIGSGTLGDFDFGVRAFTIRLTADTADICECNQPNVLEVEGPAEIDIHGIGSAVFLIPTRVFSNRPIQAVGFSRSFTIGGVDLLDLKGPDFAGCDLATSFGPILELEPYAVDQFTNVPTSFGPLSFDSVDEVTFEVIVGGGPGCLTLDFRTADDLVTPLVNGQHIDTEFGDLVTITSSGPNAGLAIFDSTPFGPNDPSQDRDLLVGTGNLLVLQTENYSPDANDVFPRPNDDSDGGTIRFDFAGPVAATSLRLIDIDGTDGPCRVVLTDSSSRQRTYTVPGEWTGDRLVAGPGHRLLDLTSLDPQPGFAAVVTAVEQAGFDPLAVVRIAVELSGSGGVDDLSLCGLPSAAVTARWGSGVNRAILASTSRPVLGSSFVASLDCGDLGGGIATLLVCGRTTEGWITPFGESLVEGSVLHRANVRFGSAPSQFTWTIPHDPALIGIEVHAQGSCIASSAGPGNKTLHRRGRLSNALDLVLGF